MSATLKRGADAMPSVEIVVLALHFGYAGTVGPISEWYVMTKAKVTGFGGFFFRAQDPTALAAWYDTHLGVNPAPTDMEMLPWMQSAGPTVFAPFAADTDYFENDRQFMLNFRVTDLDAMLAQLKAAGIAVSHEQEMEGVGRFARIHDPEGNPVELWQPPP